MAAEETASHIGNMNVNVPDGSSGSTIGNGDDEIRKVKSILVTDLAEIKGPVTSTHTELNKLDGYSGSVTELNYLKDLYDTGVTSAEFDHLDGVNNPIQTQIDGKQTLDALLTAIAALTTTQGALIYATGSDAVAVLAKGTAAQYLRMNSGATAPEWATLDAAGNNASLTDTYVFAGSSSDLEITGLSRDFSVECFTGQSVYIPAGGQMRVKYLRAAFENPAAASANITPTLTMKVGSSWYDLKESTNKPTRADSTVGELSAVNDGVTDFIERDPDIAWSIEATRYAQSGLPSDSTETVSFGFYKDDSDGLNYHGATQFAGVIVLEVIDSSSATS